MSDNTTQYLKDYQTPAYTVDEIALEFLLNESKTQVTATSTVKRLTDGQPLVLDGEDLTLVSVAIDGNVREEESLERRDGQLIINDIPNAFELTIVTELNPQQNTKLEGLYVSDGAFCTQCEAQGFRRITYYLDRPDVMAVFTTKIIAKKSAFPYLLSNGNKIDSGDLPDGLHYAVWHDPFKKPAYLFALVAGDFDLLCDKFVTRTGKEVALEFFVDKGNKAKATHAMESLKRAMRWDEERFNLEYDLDIYMVVAVDFFNMGAMENKGLNVFNSKFVLADNESATDIDFHGIESVIGHEYFHNWTGNRITCRDWFQLSLKEGLTVFRDQEFSADMGSPAVNRIDAVKVIRSHQFAEDAGPMSHPIRPTAVMEMNNFYTVTVYNKGAEVIRMIHTLIGEQRFQAGMDNYVKRFDGQAVTCDDFIDAMEVGGEVNLSQFKRWYSQSGTPAIDAVQSYDETQQRLTLTMTQHLEIGCNETLPQAFHIPVSVEILASDGNNVPIDAHGSQFVEMTQMEQIFVFENIPPNSTAIILGDFSAPVKTLFKYTSAQLIHCLTHSCSDVARWDAAQQLLTSAVLENVSATNQKTIAPQLIESLNSVLTNESLDPALVSLMLEIPSLGTLFELFEEVDVDTVIAARAFVVSQIAMQLKPTLLNRYQQCVEQLNGSSETDIIALRSLKNTLLSLLSANSDNDANRLIETQADNASNMTDSISALNCANQYQAACLDTLLSRFDEKWHDNGLVMDKWFAVIGSTPSNDVISTIKQTFEHRSFSWQNPNRVRSLIGAFAMNNQQQFHREDGRGYEFLTDQLIALNSINPQIAARLITPLMAWKKIKGSRGQLMKAQLQRLQGVNDLAKDLVEKVALSLAP